MLELWEMQSTLSLPSLLGPLWPEVVVPNRALSMGPIEQKCVLMRNWTAWYGTIFDIETVFMLNWIVWNRTVLTFNCVQTKAMLIHNWIVWIKTVWINWIAWNRNVFWQLCTYAKRNCSKKELFICIKMN